MMRPRRQPPDARRQTSNARRQTPDARRAFTLVEVLVALILLTVLMAAALPFFRVQAMMVDSQAGRADAQQNAQYAVNAIDRELRVAGIGVVPTQPLIVQADSMAITFNADLVSRSGADVSAVYFDADADPNTISVFEKEAKVTLPRSVRRYPDTTYVQAGGAPSTAETISYWVSLDSSTVAPNDYLLFRRVNAAPPRVVARSLKLTTGDPPFRYYRDSLGISVEVARSKLPLVHTAVIHGSPVDTAGSAQTDSILSVKVRLVGLFTERHSNSTIERLVESRIRVMNAGLIRHSTCGEAPIFGGSVSAVGGSVAGTPAIRISWAPALDEGAGEKDVERYAIYRRPAADLTFDEPYANLAAGLDTNATTYSFTDTDVRSGDSWVYGVAAQDCTPLTSPVSSTAAVVVP
jgi:prepilin-type N-terminal cleavage/methylation domain-containing protein